MIIKSYEVKKIDQNNNKIILLYGKNEGAKKEAINSLIINKKETFSYDQNEILENKNIFFDNIYTQSLFEEKKTIIIKRTNDKFTNIIENINLDKISNTKIILESESLERKSKLRLKFEKDKNFICVAFYPDNEHTLSKLTSMFFREKNILISPSNINLIIKKSNGDREFLFNELEKIEYFTKNGKRISSENIAKLTNLAEDHSISELVDNCLAKNKKKIDTILNENNFSNDDCILITRIFLNKLKRILKLSEMYENNKNIDLTISNARPPIFWKDKDIIKQQIHKWSSKDIKVLIYKLNKIEFLIKKNFNNSINLITDFILEITNLNNINNLT